MDRRERQAAKARMVAGMLHGQPRRVATQAAGIQISRTTAYRVCAGVRVRGEEVLDDGRHGHASKLRAPVRRWLEAYCRGAPSASGRMVRTALHEHFELDVSVRHINRVRAALGVSNTTRHAKAAGVRENHQPNPASPPRASVEPRCQDGSGSLLLLATAHATGLITALAAALPTATGQSCGSIPESTKKSGVAAYDLDVISCCGAAPSIGEQSLAFPYQARIHPAH